MVAETLPETLLWQNKQLTLLDQRRLPQETHYWRIDSIESAWEAINTLAVRGAPAIGVAAAYALTEAMQDTSPDKISYMVKLRERAAYLESARPTAVNLSWAVQRLIRAAEANPGADVLEAEAVKIHQEDLAICEALGKEGAHLIRPGMGVLTHCNAGSLATSRMGTATAPMYYQHRAGVPFKVYADETRPLYQGARLTAWELSQAGIDTTLICDNMAASLMADGHIQLAIVGTDRVTANGDVVNKIGTLNVAILCHHFDIPFYVACPSSTFDSNTASGAEVEIEQRDPVEIRGAHAANVNVLNPAFDVTPAALVSGIITERGLVAPQSIGDQLSSKS